MVQIQTTTQQIVLPTGALATGTIHIQPKISFEYDNGITRDHVSKAITVIHIENGIMTDGAGNAATISVAPTSGAGNDIANNYYEAVYHI